MLSHHGYVRIGCAVPTVRPAAVSDNVASIRAMMSQAAAQGCDLVVLPELCITGYTCADLFSQTRLRDAALQGLRDTCQASAGLPGAYVVGLPLAWQDRLFNCAAVVAGGSLVGVVPKSCIPGYHEYYEPRWFASGAEIHGACIDLDGAQIPFGTDLVFTLSGTPEVRFGIEICEDMWAVIPPSCRLALAGAAVILNPSASNDLVGKAAYREELVRQQSARCLAAYAYCSAGVGESTTDVVFAGDAMIAENGTLLARGKRFSRNPSLTVADVDLEFLAHERLINTPFAAADPGDAAAGIRHCPIRVRRAQARTLARHLDPHPFVPGDPQCRRERCQEILAIQSTGLATRLQHTGLRDLVIGLSGGLDSTLALLVCLEACDLLGLDRSGIHAITMPGFGTSERTRTNVHSLCQTLGLPLETIPIGESCKLHFRDIGHDGKTADVTYENVQARERTQILMDKANMLRALVVGTGDLSELALGWCTYNADHMSMYGVNAGVPKTLVRHLIEFYARSRAAQDTARVLDDILDTPISPELLPPDANGDIAQKTEEVVGPYELHDFFLYHAIRRGATPQKVRFLAQHVFAESHDPATIQHWLRVFYTRFFSQQFKRSCLPDGPKVGSIALSPRGDWRMPSDASAADWLAQL